MKLILALGNPGARYRDTRHNAGWWLADHLVSRWSIGPFDGAAVAATAEGPAGGANVRVIKPLTYMNRSGRVLARYLADPDFRFEDDLLVLVDDVALPPGRFRLRAKGSAGGHNGLGSIETELDSREYARLRIGVGSPHDPELDLTDWVLGVPSRAEEESILEQFGRMALAAESWLQEGIDFAMNAFNES